MDTPQRSENDYQDKKNVNHILLLYPEVRVRHGRREQLMMCVARRFALLHEFGSERTE